MTDAKQVGGRLRHGGRALGRWARSDAAVGLLIAASYLTLLLSTLDIGFTRDEGFYFTAAEQYARWFDDLADDPREAFSKRAIDKHFAYNPEHPALPKILFGLSWRLFGTMQDPAEASWARAWYDRGDPPKTKLGLMRESTAMRFPALLCATLLVFLTYRFGTHFFGRRVGVLAAVLYALMPHAFWHSHLAAFDVPVAATWFLTAYCFLRAEAGSYRWPVLTGLAWGLALSVKHNAFFIPIVFVVYTLIMRFRDFGVAREPAATPGAGARLRLRFPVPQRAFWFMLLLAPVVYYALWPKLWFDPVGHFKWYFARHAYHEYYWAYYFGTLYTKPPFPIAFPFVMSLVTVPASTLLLFALGAGRLALGLLARGAARVRTSFARVSAHFPPHTPGVVLFMALNMIVAFGVIAHPKVPIFGGTKHWLVAMPFLALFAALGFELVRAAVHALGQRVARIGGRGAQRALLAAATFAFVAPPAFETIHGYANGSTYYHALAGGHAAMGDHRLQREFWGNSAALALDYLNEHAPLNARLDFHDTAHDAVRLYWRDGLLRRDLRAVWDNARADYFLFHWHKEFLDLEAEVIDRWGVTLPEVVGAQAGVPLLNVYRRPVVPPVRRRTEVRP